MKLSIKLLALAITSILSNTVAAAEKSPQAQLDSTDTMPAQFHTYINLGAAGLLTELANFENMSVTQGRLGVSRAQTELSRAIGVTTGFKDTTKATVIPIDIMFALPNSGGKSFIRAGVITGDYDGQSGQLVEVDTTLKRAELQYFFSPNINALYGMGAYYEKSEITLAHMNGSIDRPGYGLRADALNKLSTHWGLASRLDYNIATNETALPVGPGTTLSYDLDDTRLYVQSDLVGTYSKQSLNFLPNNWVFRPALGLVYQHTGYDTVTTNLGSTATGTAGQDEDYAFISLSARFESSGIGPKRIAPHIEIGLDHEIKNEFNSLVDDPNILHVDIGTSMNINPGTRLDILYTRHDGTEGLIKDEGIVLHLGVAF